MKWEDILKNIQIAGQKTSSRDYVLPDDDEGCREWWENLLRIITKMIREVHKTYTPDHDLSDLTDEYLCRAKEQIIRDTARFYVGNKHGYYKKMGEKLPPFRMAMLEPSAMGRLPFFNIRLYLGEGTEGVVDKKTILVFTSIKIDIEDLTKDVKGYSVKTVLRLLDNFREAETELKDLLKIGGDNILTIKLGEMIDDELRERFDITKNIQISGQKTSSRDYVLPEDDEDCRDWWEKLFKILSKMIHAIDRNATQFGRNSTYTQATDEELCDVRDAILSSPIEKKFDIAAGVGHYKYAKKATGPNSGINIAGTYVEPEHFRDDSRLGFGDIHFRCTLLNVSRYVFSQYVNLWNDAMVEELDMIKRLQPVKKHIYAYDIVENFINAELELKKHINDPDPVPYIGTKLLAMYEKYLNSDIKKSITVGSQQTSSRDYVVDDEDCCEEVQKIAEKIIKFTSDEFNMDDPVRETKFGKFYLNDFYEGMPSEEMSQLDSLNLSTDYIKKLDEETCCLILETIDKYKGQNLVDVMVSAPSADGATKGVFNYSKEITANKCGFYIYFVSGKDLAASLSLSITLQGGVPPSTIASIEKIFESR